MYIKSTVFATVLSLGMVGGVPALAQGGGDNDVGEQSFKAYCANCHGESATGDGPLSKLLTVDVADITQLTANNDGVFPMLDVIHVIDGRSGLRGHEGPMPVYGEYFSSDDYGPYGSETVVRGRMLSIALYLESIQK